MMIMIVYNVQKCVCERERGFCVVMVEKLQKVYGDLYCGWGQWFLLVFPFSELSFLRCPHNKWWLSLLFNFLFLKKSFVPIIIYTTNLSNYNFFFFFSFSTFYVYYCGGWWRNEGEMSSNNWSWDFQNIAAHMACGSPLYQNLNRNHF